MTAPDPRYRYRICFGKQGALRWIGHLDLQLVWERTIRRAGLPLLFSQGFHPHPKIIFGSALPLGFTSEAELVDVWLGTELAGPVVLARLRAATVSGLHLHRVDEVALSTPSLGRVITASRYRAVLPHPCDQLEQRIERVLGAESLPRSRRKKPYDLRPLIECIKAESQHAALMMQLSCRPGATGRPEEVLLELGFDPCDCEIHRQSLVCDASDQV